MIPSVQNVRNIILIASGKGGVGKSTVATNLSVALARDGFRVGLLDADLYGPSIPLNMGVEGANPGFAKEGDKEIFTPLEHAGIKIMSLGFYMQKEQAVIWKGPMATKGLSQLLEDTRWGTLDYLVIDMPPGTGDINIAIAQKLPQAKAIIVTTPQQVAIADARKAGSLFRAKGIDVNIMGVVENMSWFTPEKHPHEKYFLFGKGGGEQLAKELDVNLLGQIPLVSDVCELGDNGKTIFNSKSKVVAQAFETLAGKVLENTGDKPDFSSIQIDTERIAH